jgi:hypothetical protein
VNQLRAGLVRVLACCPFVLKFGANSVLICYLVWLRDWRFIVEGEVLMFSQAIAPPAHHHLVHCVQGVVVEAGLEICEQLAGNDWEVGYAGP